tara:strand:- start:562 stop:741 length:180 start_codon:yes stop_codon:yes gene_type:complete
VALKSGWKRLVNDLADLEGASGVKDHGSSKETQVTFKNPYGSFSSRIEEARVRYLRSVR